MTWFYLLMAGLFLEIQYPPATLYRGANDDRPDMTAPGLEDGAGSIRLAPLICHRIV
jgi:hypothetical protein